VLALLLGFVIIKMYLRNATDYALGGWSVQLRTRKYFKRRLEAEYKSDILGTGWYSMELLKVFTLVYQP